MSIAVKKLKECPSCDNRQEPDGSYFHCEECGCRRSMRGVENHYKLRERFLDEDFVEKWKNLDADNYSDNALKIKRAIENLEDEEVRSS